MCPHLNIIRVIPIPTHNAKLAGYLTSSSAFPPSPKFGKEAEAKVSAGIELRAILERYGKRRKAIGHIIVRRE